MVPTSSNSTLTTTSSNSSATTGTIFVEILSSLLLYCLVFGMTATVDIAQMKKQVSNYKALLIGIGIQFIVLPFITFCTILLFHLPIEIGIILLVITSSPGGSYSNWWCSMFNADLALSVTMTACSTLFALLLLPMNIVLYTKLLYSQSILQSLDWTSLIVSLVVVFSGILSGLFVSYYYDNYGGCRAQQNTSISPSPSPSITASTTAPVPLQQESCCPIDSNHQHDHEYNLHGNSNSSDELRQNANRMGNISGLALILLSISVSLSHPNNDQHAAIWDQHISFYIACMVPIITGLIVAVVLGTHIKLEKPERVAVGIESCYQNTGIATTVALTMFASSEDPAAATTAIGVPLFYGIVEAIVIFIFCIVCWKCNWTKAPSNENICKVIATSYEVLETTQKHDDLEQQHVATSIEIEFGDHASSHISKQKHKSSTTVIAKQQASIDEHVVEKGTQLGTIRMNIRKLDDDSDNHTESSSTITSTSTTTMIVEPDGLMNYPNPQVSIPHPPSVFTNSPTLTEITFDDEVGHIDVIDRLRYQSRLGGGNGRRRKTIVSNLRAYATGYRRPHLPYSYDEDDNDIDLHHNDQIVNDTTTDIQQNELPFENTTVVSDGAGVLAPTPDMTPKTEQQLQQHQNRRTQYETIATNLSPQSDDSNSTTIYHQDDDISL